MAPQVAKLVAEIFAEMTFIFGDVHCDPHQAQGPCSCFVLATFVIALASKLDVGGV